MVLQSAEPRVSVLMAVYNRQDYVRDAVQSVLAQTFADFEFVIIDDGSIDGTAAAIRSFDDPRIRCYTNEANRGIVPSVNRGLALCAGGYIARMDSDDVCDPSRLEKEVRFLDANPDIGVVGTAFRFSSSPAPRMLPAADADIQSEMVFRCQLANPTVMLRKSAFAECGLAYNERFLWAEDYELWSRVAPFVKFANINEPLLTYREHEEQVSARNRKLQDEITVEIQWLFLRRLGLEQAEWSVAAHQALSSRKSRVNRAGLESAAQWAETLIAANRERNVFNEKAFAIAIAKHLYGVCYRSRKNGLRSYTAYFSKTWPCFFNPGARRRMKFFFQAILAGLFQKT